MIQKPQRSTIWLVGIALLTVIPLFAIWLATQVNIVRERQALIAEAEAFGTWSPNYAHEYRRTLRTMMGDRPISLYTISSTASDSYRARIKRAFPEGFDLSNALKGLRGGSLRSTEWVEAEQSAQAEALDERKSEPTRVD